MTKTRLSREGAAEASVGTPKERRHADQDEATGVANVGNSQLHTYGTQGPSQRASNIRGLARAE